MAKTVKKEVIQKAPATKAKAKTITDKKTTAPAKKAKVVKTDIPAKELIKTDKKSSAKKAIIEAISIPIAAEKKTKSKKAALKVDETLLLVDAVTKGMQNLKAKNIVSLDLNAVTSRICDHFVICHAQSSTQVEAIANSIEEFVRKNLGLKPWHKEGFENSEWILLDYVDVVAHIFQEEKRGFYKLEDLWADAVRTEYDNVE